MIHTGEAIVRSAALDDASTAPGRRILLPGLAVAVANDIPAHLETSAPHNVALYENIGFVVTDHLTIENGGPDVWAMQTTEAAGSSVGMQRTVR